MLSKTQSGNTFETMIIVHLEQEMEMLAEQKNQERRRNGDALRA